MKLLDFTLTPPSLRTARLSPIFPTSKRVVLNILHSRRFLRCSKFAAVKSNKLLLREFEVSLDCIVVELRADGEAVVVPVAKLAREAVRIMLFPDRRLFAVEKDVALLSFLMGADDDSYNPALELLAKAAIGGVMASHNPLKGSLDNLVS